MMSEQHKISEYIENMSFKKKVGVGLNPDEVYESICDLSAMYNDELAKTYQEVSELRAALDAWEKREERSFKLGGPLADDQPFFIGSSAPKPPIGAEKPEAPVPPKVTAPPKPMSDLLSDPSSGETFTYQSVPNAVPDPLAVSKEKQSEDELRRLGRRELLELLLTSRQENEDLARRTQELSNQNKTLVDQLKDKKLKISKAGTLAEATFMLNGVFDSVNAAAQQYLDNLQDLYDRESVQCEQREAIAREKAQKILDDASSQCDQLIENTKKKCLAMEAETRASCDVMKSRTKSEVEGYWIELSSKLEAFYEAHKGLKSLLQNAGQMPGGDARL